MQFLCSTNYDVNICCMISFFDVDAEDADYDDNGGDIVVSSISFAKRFEKMKKDCVKCLIYATYKYVCVLRSSCKCIMCKRTKQN